VLYQLSYLGAGPANGGRKSAGRYKGSISGCPDELAQGAAAHDGPEDAARARCICVLPLRSLARSWTTCAGTLARYLGRPVPRSRRQGDRMNRCDAASPRSRNGGDIKHISSSRILMNISVDYVAGLCYHPNIPLVRGVSGDDPEGGAGCGVDRGW
jgi:hypothetical protein